MLRSKEGSGEVRSHRLPSMVASALIALVGFGTMALRGSAEEGAPGVKASAEKLFSRPQLEPSVLSDGRDGMFVIRPSELAKHPAFAAMFPTLNTMLRDELAQIEGVADLNAHTPFRLESIEYIAGTPALTQRPKTAEQQGLFMMGCGELVVQFHEAVDWLGWFNEVMPSWKPTIVSGLTYFSVPIPRMGPNPLLVAARDERTIVFAYGVDHLRKLADKERAARETDVADAWNSVDGGAATFVAKAGFKESLPPEMPGGEELISMVNNVQQVAVGFDVDAASGQSQLKVTLKARSLTAGGRVQAAVQALLPLAKMALEAQLANPVTYHKDEESDRKRVLTAGTEDSNEQVGRYFLALVQNCQVELKPQQGGAAEISITATAPFPQSVFSHYEHVAVKVEEGAAASRQ